MLSYRKNSVVVILICFLFSLSYCTNNSRERTQTPSEWSQLPAVVNLSKFKSTEFLPTLENPLSQNKNSIYAAALLYAWDSLRTIYKSPIQLSDTNSNDMKLVNQSTSFRNTLKGNEYSIKAYEDEYLVYVEAFFNKALPFPKKLDKSDNPILFDKQKVSAFGMNTFDYDIAEFCTIPFYADDNRFILKLAPKEKDHEIFLVKGLKNIKTLADAVLQLKKMIEQGEKEKLDERKSWRYSLNEDDIFLIPVIKYNIEAKYKSLEGQSFITGNRNPSIVMAYQRTGFILNENGAVVESKSIVTTTDTSFVSIEKPRPKKMIFDKPFFIMMKRKEQPNPYFMMKVENAELLSKE